MKIHRLIYITIMLLLTLLNINMLVSKTLTLNPQSDFLFGTQKSSGTKVVASPKNDAHDSIKQNDTTQQTNRVIHTWEDGNGYLNVEANLINIKHEVKISVFNMLGKEIHKIYSGIPTDKNDKGHYIFISKQPLNLPKNVYMVVIQSPTFKIADKIIIAK